MKRESLKSSFTRRYMIAITLIALLSTVAFYILYLALKTSDSTALVVNISGKQRMLSQRIASFSQQYYLHVFIKQKSKDTEFDTILLLLTAAVEEMRNANEALSSGHLNSDNTVKLSKAVANIYFGDVNLKKRVDEYLRIAEEIPRAKTKAETLTLLNQLLSLANIILPDLNSAVMQYQQEGEANITAIRNLETLAWILTLITLLLEILFIFRPMAKKIEELFHEVKWNEQNLEEQIRIKTISLEEANLKLAHAASHDPLTGLKNRLNMEQELESILNYYWQNYSQFAVAMLDIDWFKKINDTHGHEAGDIVLHDIAKILTENVRGQDSVYRVGGEEFVILFNRITKEQALEKIKKIRIRIEEHPFMVKDKVIRLTVSGGLYHPELIPSKNIQEILKYADDALYEAKHLGRNKIVEAHLTESL